MKGIITDIHRASTVDGPGLRTTIFMKGCPLSCIWCHNPETQSCRVEYAFDPNKADLNQLREYGVFHDKPEMITTEDVKMLLSQLELRSKDAHINAVPYQGVFKYGHEETVESVIRTVEKDRPYYEATGGGMTVSGGEPLYQADFTIELLKMAKCCGLHTVLDTSGVASVNKLKQTIAYTDMYLLDYKASKDKIHRALTGVALTQVLKSMEVLEEEGATVILRCPLIPQLNDDDDHLKRISEISRQYSNIEAVHLMTWHTMGKCKYRKLGRYTDARLPDLNTSNEQKAKYQKIMDNAGCLNLSIN